MLLLLALPAFRNDAARAQQRFDYIEATDLTIVGKVFPDTPDPYKRMDYSKYGGWTAEDTRLLDQSSGIIVCFRTDAPTIVMRAIVTGGWGSNAGDRGFDLYIKKDGRWLWAGADPIQPGNNDYRYAPLLKDGDPVMKECMVYFPNFCVLKSAQVGIPSGYTIEAGEKPFRYDIALYGSSFTHGACSSRAGNSLPGFLTRMTGFQFNSLGVAGDCKMQPQFRETLKDARADAFFFDTFSNPDPTEIRERTIPFIEAIAESHPGVPLIFIRTIYRERRNFSSKWNRIDSTKLAVADSIMAVAVKRYKDVYYIKTSNATSPDHETSVDGTHPNDFGYHLWAESLRKPLLRILRKYGIK